MHYLNLVLFWVFFGFLSSYLARKKGRNPTLWFWLGIFLGVIGVAVIALLPKVRPEPIYVPPSPQREIISKPWYYLDSTRAAKGPYTLQELRKILQDEKMGPSTYLWEEGMENWRKLSELSEFQKQK